MLRDITISLVFMALTGNVMAAETTIVALTGKTVIEGDQVTVGDVFTNTGEHADFVLAPAPTAAKPLVLTATDLNRIATYFKLKWMPAADQQPIILKTAKADEDSVMVPVLAVPLAPDSVINATDIVEIPVARSALRAAMILKKDELIGMIPKRTIMANQPIMHHEIALPILVKRNELITVRYQSGPINLTTKARAAKNASKGDTVTLINLTSKKPFQAVVSGPSMADAIVEINS